MYDPYTHYQAIISNKSIIPDGGNMAVNVTLRQTTLLSENKLKTINGESIVGSGDITIDLSSYVTTDYVDTKIGDINNVLEAILG